jgi:hypothetical protein
MPPAGALNRCRSYVPARVMWGAVTAEVSRLEAGNSFPHYMDTGEKIADNCRFTYLYPAEKIGGDYLAWLPKFEMRRGLVWQRQDGAETELDRKFKRTLLGARAGTAITPETDSASEGTLRETECINPWWRETRKTGGEPKPVYLLGYVFLKKNSVQQKLRDIVALHIGGDVKYGFGRIRRVEWEAYNNQDIFGKRYQLHNENPVIESKIVLGHAFVEENSEPVNILGMKELLGGWDHGELWNCSRSAWAPGSLSQEPVQWRISGKGGYWIY